MTASPPPSDGASAVARLFGVMLMVLGVLFMSLGGLCSLAVIGFTAVDMVSHFNVALLGDALGPLIYGGILPVGIGFGLFVLGRRLGRGRTKAS